MITTLLIDNDFLAGQKLQLQLRKYFPRIEIVGSVSTVNEAFNIFNTHPPELMFVDWESAVRLNTLSPGKIQNTETFILDKPRDCHPDPFVFEISGFLPKPVEESELIPLVRNAQRWIQFRQEQCSISRMLSNLVKQSAPSNIVQIPTERGFEFMMTQEIIRCEGIQRVTQIVSNLSNKMVSSYHIGFLGRCFNPIIFSLLINPTLST